MIFLFYLNIPLVSSPDFTSRGNLKDRLNKTAERSEGAVLIPEKSSNETLKLEEMPWQALVA